MLSDGKPHRQVTGPWRRSCARCQRPAGDPPPPRVSRAKSAPSRRRKPVRRRNRIAPLPSLRRVLARLRPRTPLLGERGREVLGARTAGLRAVPRVRDLRRLGRRQRRPRAHGRPRLDPREGPRVRPAGAAGGRDRAAAGPRARPGTAAACGRDSACSPPSRWRSPPARSASAPAPAPHSQAWTSAHMQSHGGVVGEALFRLAGPLVHGLGVGILVVFLAITGTMLLTGSSLGALVRAGAQALAGIATPAARTPLRRVRLRGSGRPRRRRRLRGRRARTRAAHPRRRSLRRGLPVGRRAGAAPAGGRRRLRDRGPGRAARRRGGRRRTRRERRGGGRRRRRDLLPGHRRRRAADPPGALPRGRHRRPRVRLGAARSEQAVDPLRGGGRPPGHGRAGADRPQPGGGAGPLRRAGEGDRDRRRPPHHPLRVAPGPGHEGGRGGEAQGRPRLRPGSHRHPHPRADPRQAGGGRGGAQRAAQDRAAGGRLRGAPAGLLAVDRVARQGRGRQGDRGGPGEDAPPAGGRYHRSGEVRCHQRDALQPLATGHPARTAARAGGPQAGGAQPLRVDPAPADAGDHEPADGRQRARQPGQGDGVPLRDHVAVADPQPDGAQQGPRPPRAKRRSRTSCA